MYYTFEFTDSCTSNVSCHLSVHYTSSLVIKDLVYEAKAKT